VHHIQLFFRDLREGSRRRAGKAASIGSIIQFSFAEDQLGVADQLRYLIRSVAET